MGMIQNALNQSMLSLLGGAIGYTQSPYYKNQQTIKEYELKADALSKLKEQDREAYLEGLTSIGGDLQKGIVSEYLLPGTKGKEGYADTLAGTMQVQSQARHELEALRAQREAQEAKAGIQGAVEARRKTIDAAKKKTVAELSADIPGMMRASEAADPGAAERKARDEEIAEVKKQLMAKGVSEAMAERAATEDYERRQKK